MIWCPVFIVQFCRFMCFLLLFEDLATQAMKSVVATYVLVPAVLRSAGINFSPFILQNTLQIQQSKMLKNQLSILTNQLLAQSMG